ncbi:MAG: hypothetical protein LBM01_00480 [Christensenellaceae bacterium]|nr:hypothetical protein [Christensenellaceae bacterium]
MAKILAISFLGKDMPLEALLFSGACLILAFALFIALLTTSLKYNPKFKLKKFRKAAKNKSVVSFKYFTLGDNGKRVYQYETFRFLENDTGDEQFDGDGERYYVNARGIVFEKGKYYLSATSPYSTVIVHYLIENIDDFRVEKKHGNLKPLESTDKYDRESAENPAAGGKEKEKNEETSVGVIL